MQGSSATILIDDFARDPEISPCVERRVRIAPREGRYAEMPPSVPAALRAALAARGVERLYTHQAASYEAARAGDNLVVVTPTASGKTLCFDLPVLSRLVEDPEARALFLFPTKALAQDQQAALNELLLSAPAASPLREVKVVTYDGDTPSSLRIAARDTGRIVITNPDMLHSGVLPNHPKWNKFFEKLAYVVIDEMHVYKGVFGSHVANLVRRLKRIAAFYGSRPAFILCSATIGNPAELAQALIGEDVRLVDENGAPGGEKQLFFYNPPLVDPVQGIRKSVATESERVALAFLRRGVKTILFARSRVRTEIIASYIAEELRNLWTGNSGIRVEPYRGGYLPSERREIERGLREGSIQGVVSTNALELGIDIGGLDAAVLAGFPGSLASFWQQSGRAGRRSGASAVVFVASSSPLDQYMMAHPEYFLGGGRETARIDADNPYIYFDHVKCAAFELPFSETDEFGPELQAALAILQEEGSLRKTGGKWYWSDRGYPSEAISLRSATSENIVIVDATKGRNEVIGEMDRPSAKELIFDDAVYIHRGRQFIVKKLDIDDKKCLVAEAEVNYFTDAVVKTDIKVLSEDERDDGPEWASVIGDVLVRSQVSKYKKLRFHTHENIGYGEVHQDEEELQTRACVLLFPPEGGAGAIIEAAAGQLKAGILGALGRLLKGMLPAFILCDQRDIGCAERVRDPHFGAPAVYFYDMYPGGTGLAEAVPGKLARLFEAARSSLSACACESGCPSCIGAAGEREGPSGRTVKAKVAEILASLRIPE